MNTFKVGDVVQLKSGGPQMTIADCYGDNIYRCEWFIKDDELKFDNFAGDSLKLFDLTVEDNE